MATPIFDPKDLTERTAVAGTTIHLRYVPPTVKTR
jgi:hypothetical protein